MDLLKLKRPTSIKVALLFIILGAILWLSFGLVVAAGLHPAIPESDAIRWGMATMSFITSAIFLGLFFMLRIKNSRAYWPTLGLLMLISILSITDEFGLADLVVLFITLVPFTLLIINRRWYLRPGSERI